ncbi:MAG: 2'-5' RNA ligase family protein [Chryseobacterium sp.]|nr:MAG: 2'-5' RNA ligase family protein [Chryseobacterium sp.]
MKHLFFIAVAPDEELTAEIRKINKDFAERFDSEKALKSFPHITLVPPFSVKEEDEAALKEHFESIELTVQPFEQRLKDYGCFERKNPTIFIRPENTEELQQLHKEVAVKMDKEINENFHPHLTVAFRDLTKENFAEAWKEYQDKEFTASFTVDRVGLYRHDGKQWELFAPKALR